MIFVIYADMKNLSIQGKKGEFAYIEVVHAYIMEGKDEP